MRLEAVRIKQFRSIQDVTLENIGNLNVLIGKNNSGKSNILLAIDSFFTCIKDGSLVTSDLPIGTAIDYHRRNTSEPIEIKLSFSMTSADHKDLVRDIVNEAPQMRNAADGIERACRVTASMRIISVPKRTAFINDVSLCTAGQAPEKVVPLLVVSDEAALELLEKFRGVARARRQGAGLEKFTQALEGEDWARIKERLREGAPLRYYYMQKGGLDAETFNKIEPMIHEASSMADLKRSIESYVAQAKQEAQKVLHEPLENKVSTFAGDETEIPKYAHNLLRRIGAINVLYLKERRRPIGEDEAKRLLSLKVQRGGTEVLQNIQDTVASLLGVRIDAFNSDSPGKEAEMDVDDFLAEVNGSGIREALRLVLDFEFQKPELFLVEEPEIYLHPSLETSMMRYLKTISSLAQVFITTHSTNFLDTAEMKNVYLVSKPQSTKVQQLNFEEAEIQIPAELGIRLSSLFLFDRLIFVEGPSDEGVLREWAAKLHTNLSQVGAGFVHMGGVHNFGYFAAEQTLNFLMKRNVKVWFLLDRDEKEESDISHLAKKCGPNVSLKVLRKRELENYLIVPRVLGGFVGLKRKLGGMATQGQPPSEDEIVKEIEIVADGLKALAIEKRVVKLFSKPFYPLSRRLFEDGAPIGCEKIAHEIEKTLAHFEMSRAKIEQACAEQTKLVEEAWEKNKLDVVPGDLLLDGVCKAFGVRFRKDADGSRIAALFRPDEIDDEIQGILREIGD
jgi:predicted ATPase